MHDKIKSKILYVPLKFLEEEGDEEIERESPRQEERTTRSM